MLRRFVSAAAVAAMFLLLAAIAVVLLPPARLERIHPLLVAWLCAPALWGIWSLLAPQSWVPGRLPSWGALLGLVAGIFAMFVLNAPARAFDMWLSRQARGAGLLLIVVFYYAGWMIVRAVLRKLTEAAASPGRDIAKAA